jgi:hypothetical protein
MQAAPLPVMRRVARLPERLGPKALRHFVALLAVPDCFTALLWLVHVENQLTSVAADKHHGRYGTGKSG